MVVRGRSGAMASARTLAGIMTTEEKEKDEGIHRDN